MFLFQQFQTTYGYERLHYVICCCQVTQLPASFLQGDPDAGSRSLSLHLLYSLFYVKLFCTLPEWFSFGFTVRLRHRLEGFFILIQRNAYPLYIFCIFSWFAFPQLGLPPNLYIHCFVPLLKSARSVVIELVSNNLFLKHY